MCRFFFLYCLISSSAWALTIQEALAPEVFRNNPASFIEALATTSDVEGPGPRSYLLQLLSFEELSDPLTDHHKALEALLETNVCLRTQDAETGDTPLTVALDAGQSTDIIRLLILHGASLDTARDDGLAPIQLAVGRADVNLIRVLGNSGARLDVYENTMTLLDALEKTNLWAPECMEYLAARDVKRSSMIEEATLFMEAAFYAAQTGNLKGLQHFAPDCYLGYADRHGRTIFHHAAIGQNAELMSFLAPTPKDLEAADNCGKTPGDLAQIFSRDERSHYAKTHTKLALPTGTGPKLHADYIGQVKASEFSWTDPLWNAARYNYADSLKHLSKTRRDSLQAKDSTGKCLLDYASILSFSTIKILLESGARLPTPKELLTLSAHELIEGSDDIYFLRKLAIFQAYGVMFSPADFDIFKQSQTDYETLRQSRNSSPLPLRDINSLVLPDMQMATLCTLGNFDKAKSALDAAARGDLDTLKTIYDYSLSSILIPGPDGIYTTALILALSAEHKEVASYLINTVTDCSLISQSKQTALGCAIDLQDRDIIIQLLDQLRPSDIAASKSHRLGRILHPLVQAALLQDAATMELLFDLGIDPSVLMPYLGELLTSAASQDPAFLNYLLKNGVDCNSQDQNGTTALLAAIKAKQQAVIDLLLAMPELLVDLSDNSGLSPLMAAALQDNAAVITQLAAKGAVLELVNTNKQSALELALRAGSKNAVQALLAAGVKLNTVNQVGATPIIVAASCRDAESIVSLLDQGALINSADGDGNTALHIAVLAGYEEIATLLLDKGADCLRLNAAGKSALVYARDMKQDQLVSLMCSLTEPTIAEWVQGITQVAIGFVLLILASLLFFDGKRLLYTRQVARWGREVGKSATLSTVSSVLLSVISGTQAATTSVATWLFEADLLSLRRYILALGFADLGACAILFIVGLPLLWPIGICLGLFGLLFMQEKPESWRPYLVYPCALGLTLLGVSSIDTTITHLASTPTIISATKLASTWTIAGVAVGFVSGLVFQSLVGMQLGLLTFAYVNQSPLEGLFAVYVGAVAAGSILPYYTTTPFGPKTAFVSPLFTRLALVWSGTLFIDILIERYLNLPLMMAASSALFSTRWQQLLALFLLAPLAKAILTLVSMNRLESFAQARRLPENLRACMQPRFLDPYFKKDELSLLKDLEQEQVDLLARVEIYPSTLANAGLLDEHHSAFKGIHREIASACKELKTTDKRLETIIRQQKRIDIYERLAYRFGSKLATVVDGKLRPKLEFIFSLLCQGRKHREALAEELSALKKEPNPEAAEPAAFLEEILKVAGQLN